MSPTTALVPPHRLGALLRRAREDRSIELAELSGTSGFSVAELEDIEHGRRRLDEATLDAIVATYQIDDSAVIPARAELVIDLDESRISVGDTRADELRPSSGPDSVLTRYLALVYRLREQPVGTPLPLRDIDIEILADALLLRRGSVEKRLQRLISEQDLVAQDQRRIRRQLVMPLVGVIIAATAIGTLVLVADRDDPENPGTGVATVIEGAPEPETDIGNGGAIEVDPDR